jgi:hypothetical protein
MEMCKTRKEVMKKETNNRITKRPCHSVPCLIWENSIKIPQKGSLLPRLQMLYAPHSKAPSLRKSSQGSA